MILNILVTNYPKEFNVLKELALNGGKYISNFVDDNALLHLLGYGLIENVDGIYKIRFKTRFMFHRENKNKKRTRRNGQVK